ncbi:MAG: hypothetical protein HYX84_08750 [Chloroflexi bacterium]|nr:hypothetical protein [Chloroflexota bacterium]
MRWLAAQASRLWRWLGRIPKGVLFSAAIALVAIIVFSGFQFFRFYNYTQEDPNFCRSCHLMEQAWDKWAISQHKDVTCHSCHEQSVIESSRLVVSFALGRYQRVESHAVVKDEACEECHESANIRWPQVAATAGHKVHTEEQNLACTKCHSTTLHRFEAPGPICQVCHIEKRVITPAMADFHCSTCHNFLSTEEKLHPTRKACLDCHQTRAVETVNWPADAPMQFECATCHKPHELVLPDVACQTCHTATGAHTERSHATSSCQTCHKPHEWQVSQRDTCTSCHAAQVEHQVGFFCGTCHSFTAR